MSMNDVPYLELPCVDVQPITIAVIIDEDDCYGQIPGSATERLTHGIDFFLVIDQEGT
jgi:hypothetical protein